MELQTIINGLLAVIVGGIGTLVVVALVALFAPQLRALGSIEEIRPE